MQKYNSNEFLNLLDSNSLTPYNCYNLDLDYQQYYSIKHYIENQTDNLEQDQKLNILMFDIELYTNNSGSFPKIDQAKYPINAMTIYSTKENIFKSYILLQHSNINSFPIKEQIPNLIIDFKKQLLDDKYIDIEEGIEFEIYSFTKEEDLIRSCWNEVKRIDPTVLSSWNGDHFDLPYLYFRLLNLFQKNDSEVGKLLSSFGTVKMNKFGNDFMISIPEMPLSDLLYLYKPRDESGLNYGQKLNSYSLDSVAEEELGLKKKEYKNEGITLDTFYETDPINFLLYNIIDVILVKKLNQKLKHIDSHNLLRRLMKTSFSNSLRGSTALFDTFINYELNRTGKYVRFGIVEEVNTAISEDELCNIYIPKSMNKTVRDIDQQTYRNITCKFSGAYVKQPKAQILTAKDGIIIDLDATSLYPSMINQTNISFDTYYGKIIEPWTYKILTVIKNILKNNGKISDQIYASIYDLVCKNAIRLQPQNKSEYIQHCYLIISHCLKTIENYKKPIEQLFNPINLNDYIILKKFLIPLIELLDEIHPNSKEYNSFCNEYLLNNTDFGIEFKKKYGEYMIDITTGDEIPKLYIIEDILQPNLHINRIPVTEFANYLKQKQLIVSLSGCLFLKHEVKPGLFIDFLKNLKSMRSNYEKLRNEYDEKSELYSFYDMRQKAIKVTANTTLIYHSVTCQ